MGVKTSSEGRWKKAFWWSFLGTGLIYAVLLPPLFTDIPPWIFYPSIFSSLQFKLTHVHPDQDKDGLSDATERRLKTYVDSQDTDGDGLNDYDEVHKYNLNPLTADSDGDGKGDFLWEERWEYQRVFRVIVDLRPPFHVEDMNDFYQDARLLRENPDGSTRVEVILYPDAQEVLNPESYQPRDSVWTQPTYGKNLNPSMIREIRDGLPEKPRSQLAVLQALQGEFNHYRYISISKESGYSTDLPLQFQHYRSTDGQMMSSWAGEATSVPMKELLQRFYFAEGMYRRKTRGACSSSATLRGALFRAAGLEERSIFTIPLFYTLLEDQTHVDVTSSYPAKSMDIPKGFTLIADHVFNEVKIGNRWIRVDTGIVDTGLGERNGGPYLKIASFHDQADEDWQYWNYATWQEKRPFIYREITELFPEHRS
ncbi:MAG: hypothetical protein MI717_14730 [Spirochaetales bacterium]|nr:hypothetical protein [Spirochaetales bacterium]